MPTEIGFGSGVICKKLYPVPETVTQNVYTKGDAGSGFDGRNGAGKTVVLLHHPRFLFHFRKGDREELIVVRIIFAGKANQRFATSVIGMARRRANGCCGATATPTRS
jgi:hypothetical protein